MTKNKRSKDNNFGLHVFVSIAIVIIGVILLNTSLIEENKISNSKYGYYYFSIGVSGDERFPEFYKFKLILDYQKEEGNLILL